MLSTTPQATASWRNLSRPALLRRRAEPSTPGSEASGAALSVDVIIGVPTGKVASATFPLILRGIHERAQVEVRERPEVGSIRISVHRQAPGEFHPENGRHGHRPAPERNRHGTLLVYPFAESAVETVSRRDFTVSVLESYTRLGIDAIDTDDDEAFASLVGRLHGAGHSRIGFLTWHYPVGGHWAERRFSGFARGLRARGLRLDHDCVLNAGDDGAPLGCAEVSEAALRLTKDAGVTAWVCAADHQAYPLIEFLQARGIRVPQDCSVTGFDGLEPPPGLPCASSARVAHEHIGSSAITRMINRILYPSSPPRRILVGAHPVAGETIAAPRQP
jgi:LacI family transcriptional regulator